MSDPQGNSVKHQNSRESKTNWLPDGPDIKCIVMILDFKFYSDIRISAANQTGQLDSYKITNLILKTTQ